MQTTRCTIVAVLAVVLPSCAWQPTSLDHKHALSEMADRAANDSARCQSSGGRSRITGLSTVPGLTRGQDQHRKRWPVRSRSYGSLEQLNKIAIPVWPRIYALG